MKITRKNTWKLVHTWNGFLIYLIGLDWIKKKNNIFNTRLEMLQKLYPPKLHSLNYYRKRGTYCYQSYWMTHWIWCLDKIICDQSTLILKGFPHLHAQFHAKADYLFRYIFGKSFCTTSDVNFSILITSRRMFDGSVP